MQICANELMRVMKNVLAKREYTVEIKGDALCSFLGS